MTQSEKIDDSGTEKIGYAEASKRIREFVRLLNVDWPPHIATAERGAVTILTVAWCDAVRDEWQAVVAGNETLRRAYPVARKMMDDAGYSAEHVGVDPVCAVPGHKPMMAGDVICFEHSIWGALPLSSIYTNRVVEALEIAGKVAAEEKKQ